MVPDALKPAICTNCHGRGVFVGDEGCGCMECPPDKQADCFVCGGSGLNPDMIVENVTWGDKDEWSPTYHPRAVVIPLEVSDE